MQELDFQAQAWFNKLNSVQTQSVIGIPSDLFEEIKKHIYLSHRENFSIVL